MLKLTLGRLVIESSEIFIPLIRYVSHIEPRFIISAYWIFSVPCAYLLWFVCGKIKKRRLGYEPSVCAYFFE